MTRFTVLGRPRSRLLAAALIVALLAPDLAVRAHADEAHDAPPVVGAQARDGDARDGDMDDDDDRDAADRRDRDDRRDRAEPARPEMRDDDEEDDEAMDPRAPSVPDREPGRDATVGGEMGRRLAERERRIAELREEIAKLREVSRQRELALAAAEERARFRIQDDRVQRILDRMDKVLTQTTERIEKLESHILRAQILSIVGPIIGLLIGRFF